MVESSVGASFLLLAKVMEYLVIEGSEATTRGLLYSAVYSVILFLLLTLRNFYKFKNSRLFVNIRASVSSLIYHKALSLGIPSLAK